jgi:hypothetical protein
MYIEEIATYFYTEQERYPIDNIPTDIINSVHKYNVLRKRDHFIWFSATGFLICDNYLIVILPKGYQVTDNIDALLLDSRLLFSTLVKYKDEGKLDPQEMELLGGGEGDIDTSIFVALRIIEDYKNYGLIKRNIKNFCKNSSGNINWSYTVNKTIPIISKNRPIYHDAIYQKNKIDESSLIVKLHKYAISKSIHRFGWILGIGKDDFSSFDLEIPCERNYAVHLLEKELKKVFIQREIELLQWIINLIQGKSYFESHVNIEMLLTKSFYYVWEAICGRIVQSQYSTLKRFLPQPIWKMEEGLSERKISHRPDILLIRNKKFYILDAKYYNYAEHLPGWQDAVKQFFYSLSIKKNIENNSIEVDDWKLKNTLENIRSYENVFLMPMFVEGAIIKIGSVAVPNVSEYGVINAFAINLRIAMECYIGEKNYNFIDQIDELINRQPPAIN